VTGREDGNDGERRVTTEGGESRSTKRIAERAAA
jgi:hypothetical protein